MKVCNEVSYSSEVSQLDLVSVCLARVIYASTVFIIVSRLLMLLLHEACVTSFVCSEMTVWTVWRH